MYTEAQGMMNFFVPVGSSALDREDLAASAAAHGEMVCIRRCKIWKVGFALDEAVAGDNTAPAIKFKHRPTVGSATGESDVATITFADGDGPGENVTKELTSYQEVKPGESIEFDHVTQAADSGTAAGQGYYFFLCVDDPEIKANETNEIDSQ